MCNNYVARYTVKRPLRNMSAAIRPTPARIGMALAGLLALCTIQVVYFLKVLRPVLTPGTSNDAALDTAIRSNILFTALLLGSIVGSDLLLTLLARMRGRSSMWAATSLLGPLALLVAFYLALQGPTAVLQWIRAVLAYPLWIASVVLMVPISSDPLYIPENIPVVGAEVVEFATRYFVDRLPATMMGSTGVVLGLASLAFIAEQRGRREAWSLFALFAIPGMVIGLVALLAMSSKLAPASASPEL